MKDINLMIWILRLGVAILIAGFSVHYFFGTNGVAAEWIEEGALIIDVRTADEFAGGHVEGAINIPHNQIGAAIAAIEPNKGRAIIVYCRSGGRAGVAQRILEQAGYTQVVNGGSLSKMKASMP